MFSEAETILAEAEAAAWLARGNEPVSLFLTDASLTMARISGEER